MLRSIVVACSLALLPAARGWEGGSWVGKKVLAKKSGCGSARQTTKAGGGTSPP
jgi:hypothetical protein